MRINWNEIIEMIKIELEVYEIEGFKPTLRSMFYRLYTKGLIPNTSASYTSLDRATVKARWSGHLPINCFTDNSRKVLNKFSEDFFSPEEFIDNRLKIIQSIPCNYINLIPKWHNQPHYVEVWTEKDAQVGLLRSILRGGTGNTIDRQVRIVATRGYSGPAFNFPNVKRLKAWQTMGKKVHIVYFGDMDPSGENIEEVVNDKLVRYGLVNIDFQRIAITDEQIDEYGLPLNPDPATLAKLEGDSRRWQFMENHNGELFQVEVDALAALAPDAFRDLVLNSVDQFYNEKVYEDALNEYTEGYIRKMLKKTAKDLTRRL